MGDLDHLTILANALQVDSRLFLWQVLIRLIQKFYS